ncbi:feruloyl esteras-like protein B precursor [Aaosphaeria arxii CBS 175.79]|uniref:Carboxylic ester hydrolase n=1 Tax=Aaosphaeria arxii CBS 175.79 TaxID=1450172 RepID=A0A6A5XQW9_9PLEO|nr:feruloyl esteras-like protein B precursor [Aaosphaeria arxii CBS 175.79]KAF2015237.1 feruloyl esteras-like protein B precursor [Aaosphaeria arxii CBS 175.79]
MMKVNQLLGFSAVLSATSALECSPSAIQAALPSNATVNFAQALPANSTFEVPKSDTGYPGSPIGLPALCAVSIQVKSIGNSTFGLGLFLPDDWNGRFLAVGNGGFAGGINWLDMAPGVRYGFATMSTDTGHNSSTIDGSWAYQQPEKIENWGHLAMHGSTVVAKTVIPAYYSQEISFNYYAGCSTGGRQGLKEAELYPDDFDGIVAGAPAWWTSHLQPWTIKVASYNLPTSADYHIPPSLFGVVQKEVMRQCDSQDGVKDGIISSPDTCSFRPEDLLCGESPTNSTDCLTAPQISTLYKLYSDFVGENQTFFYPHLNLGTESQWRIHLASDAPNPLGTGYPQFFMGFGADWRWQDFNEDVQRLADRTDPGNASVKFDLSSFHAKGGKIISYHGMIDAHIPTNSLKYFYNQVDRTLKPLGVDVDSFFRAFFVPGMAHCAGTDVDAPWYFAGPNQAGQLGPTVHGVPGFEDRDHDVLLALLAWVEEGVKPEKIVGTKYVNETLHSEVLRQRPLCMYPKQARYVGNGDVNDAESWTCKYPYE